MGSPVGINYWHTFANIVVNLYDMAEIDNILRTKDGRAWRDVTNEARMMWSDASENLYELTLYGDDYAVALIETKEQLNEAMRNSIVCIKTDKPT